MKVCRISPAEPAAQALIAELDRTMEALYPAESNHLESIAALLAPNVCFLGCYLGKTLAGCGAVKIMEDDGRYGEIKRMFVTPEHRGKGISAALMQQIEAHLQENGIPLSRLETGIHSSEARGLYEKFGYRYREPFGGYKVDPLSVFMEKPLST
ncbi:MAG: GNAT family N-acetyltransferase [Burkholderiaceae bacterium]|nr:GNAT family N-acetyltransferase [Burkholderiaceae bacterium]